MNTTSCANDELPERRIICGVDEAGRGPLCGSVVAAAVILDPDRPIDGLGDSKKLTPRSRTRLALLIRERALCWAVGEASAEEIDCLNILQATMLAMIRAVNGLSLRPDLVRVDGNRCPPLPMATEAVIKGDASVAAISAASILAKTVRDTQLDALDAQYPQYGFAKHKGYPTAAHLVALRTHGVIDCYRRTFGPVRDLLDEAAAEQAQRESHLT